MDVGSKTPVRTPRGEGKQLGERLIQTALTMIDEGDHAGISIREVTKRTGVSPTAFYLHFENRDQLLPACFERSFAAFRDQLRAAVGSTEDPRERLLQAGLAYIKFACTYPERYALIFETVDPPLPSASGSSPSDPSPDPATAQEASGAAVEAFQDLVALVLDYLGPDDPRRDEAELLAKGIWAGLHGYVMLRYRRPAVGWPGDREFATRLAEAWLG